MHNLNNTVVCGVCCWDICSKFRQSDELQCLHHNMRCWPISQWKLHSHHNTNMCCLCCWVLCTVFWRTDKLHSMHIYMQCWSVYQRIMYIYRHTRLQQLWCWILCCRCWVTNCVHHLCSRVISTQCLTDCLPKLHKLLLCWAIYEWFMHFNHNTQL